MEVAALEDVAGFATEYGVVVTLAAEIVVELLALVSTGDTAEAELVAAAAEVDVTGAVLAELAASLPLLAPSVTPTLYEDTVKTALLPVNLEPHVSLKSARWRGAGTYASVPAPTLTRYWLLSKL
jgi:hypothetical protein